jgi:hypothetical protein
MAKALTQLAIEAIRPGPARREIPDGKERGLYLVIQPTGGKAWVFRYRDHGRPCKLTIGPYPAIGLAKARGEAARAKVSLAEGDDPRARKAEQAERDRGRQAAHDELARWEAEIAEVEQRIGFREIEARKDSAYDAVWDAEYDVMEAKPATPAGGVALLRFVAGLMEDLFPDDDEHEHYAGAIRNAADFFEGSASA